MRKKLTQLLVLMLICSLSIWMAACGSNEDETADDLDQIESEEYEEDDASDRTNPEDELEEGDTLDEEFKVRPLEEGLSVLAVDGYKRSNNGAYIAKEMDEGVISEREVRAEGNHLIVKLTYDYGSDANNKRMIKFFKENPDDAVSIMVSSFLVRVADAVNAYEGDMEYTIYVGKKKAASGTMTLEEADTFSIMADDIGGDDEGDYDDDFGSDD